LFEKDSKHRMRSSLEEVVRTGNIKGNKEKKKLSEWYWFNKKIDYIIAITIWFSLFFFVFIILSIVLFSRNQYTASAISVVILAILIVGYVLVLNEKKKLGIQKELIGPFLDLILCTIGSFLVIIAGFLTLLDNLLYGILFIISGFLVIFIVWGYWKSKSANLK
jgi:hypothetical protein